MVQGEREIKKEMENITKTCLGEGLAEVVEEDGDTVG